MSLEMLKPGQSAELETEVTKELATNRMGREGAEILSTPSLLALMERCCIKASDHLLPERHTTVGYAVDGMRHLAPTPLGNTVLVRSVLTEVDRNRLTYSIEAFDGNTKIGVAIHKRAVISQDG